MSVDFTDLLCHKTYEAHWGIIFQKGKSYIPTFKDNEISLITNYDKYYEKISLISSSITFIRKGHTKEELPSLMDGYIDYKEVQKLYTARIIIPISNIAGDDGHSYDFCNLTRKEILEKYNSCKFTTTLHFLEDNFYTQSDLREQAIGSILK